MQTGYFASRCEKCNRVMWVEATSFGGITRTHSDFKKEVMKQGDEQEIEREARIANYHSNINYD